MTHFQLQAIRDELLNEATKVLKDCRDHADSPTSNEHFIISMVVSGVLAGLSKAFHAATKVPSDA